MSTRSITPVTCKQLSSVSTDTPQPHLGFFPVTVASLVGFVTNVEEEGNRLIINVEDGTNQLVGLEVYDFERFHKPTSFEYIEFILNLTISGDGGIKYFVQSMRPITDHNQIVSHLLTAYANHLRCCIRPTPLPTHKAYQKLKQTQMQTDGGGGTSNFTSGFTGINYQQNAAIPTANRNTMNDGLDPVQKILTFLQSRSDIEGQTLQHISNATQLSVGMLQQMLPKLIEDGQIYTGIDEQHFCAL